MQLKVVAISSKILCHRHRRLFELLLQRRNRIQRGRRFSVTGVFVPLLHLVVF